QPLGPRRIIVRTDTLLYFADFGTSDHGAPWAGKQLAPGGWFLTAYKSVLCSEPAKPTPYFPEAYGCQIYLRNRRCGQLARKGAGFRVDRLPARGARAEGLASEVRSLPERRPGHH